MSRNLIYTLELPGETPSNNEIKGMHFHVYKKTRKGWQDKVLAALGGKLPDKPLENAYLEVDRHCAGGGLDWDNAYGGLKPLLDCLVAQSKRNPDGLGLITDDNPRAMPEPPYLRQLPAKRGQGRTVVRIYSLT